MQRKHLLIIALLAALAVFAALYFYNSARQAPGGPCPVTVLEGDCKVSSISDAYIRITPDIQHYNNYSVLVIDWTFTPTKPMEGSENLGPVERELIKENLVNERHAAYARDLAYNGIRCLLKPGMDQNDYAYKSVKENCTLGADNAYRCSFPDITRQDLEDCGIRIGAVVHCKLTRRGGSCPPGGFEYFER